LLLTKYISLDFAAPKININNSENLSACNYKSIILLSENKFIA